MMRYHVGAVRTGTCEECDSSFTWTQKRGGQPRRLCDNCKMRSQTGELGRAYQEAYRLRRVGLTPESFAELAANGCALCGSLEHHHKNWNIDHDHGCCELGCSECFRGLLCWHCNVALGHFRDDPALIRSAAEYVERHRA